MANKEAKAELIAEIKEMLDRAEFVIATDYRGLTVAGISELRAKLREQKVDYRVVKNTLAAFAATESGKADLSKFLVGPTALAIGYDDVVQPTKVVMDYLRSSKGAISVKGGVLGDRLLTEADIEVISRLPPKEELIARCVGLVQSPISRLLNVLNGNLQGLVGLLQARAKQLEGG
ncbi:MAG: 50S ribosomal protein L10 [Dehalococcoidia bacterium]|nr:50S ribosomal protein L10 [Dehalococcoidia bacterium]